MGKEEEHLSIAQTQARRKRAKTVDSIVPILAIGLKGKAVEIPSSKKQKKRKKSKPLVEGELKEKLLFFATRATKITKVHLRLRCKIIYLA